MCPYIYLAHVFRDTVPVTQKYFCVSDDSGVARKDLRNLGACPLQVPLSDIPVSGEDGAVNRERTKKYSQDERGDTREGAK